MTDLELAKMAIEAKSKGLPTYSHFHVGAALESSEGRVYLGANIENSSYGLTICAERTAAFTAIIDGARSFNRMAIAGDTDDFLPPCGACRQVLADLCGKDLRVILIDAQENIKSIPLSELLPHAFDESFLK